MSGIIEPYVHTCTISSGPLAGNNHEQTVDRWDIEWKHHCDICGEPLATVEQITIHIYEQLTKEAGT